MLEWTCPADWASKGPNASMGMPLLWGLASGTASPFFKPYQLPPSPCVRRVWARAVTFLVSDAISACLLGDRLVKAFSPSYVLR